MPVYQIDDRIGRIASDAWVAPSAMVIGEVHMADESSVWFGAVIRGDNEPIRIGRQSNVQENAVLHADPGFPLLIGERVTIGHQVMLTAARSATSR